MKCQKCKSDFEKQGNTCPFCGNFLYRPILKEILRIIKRYYSKNDYTSIKELLYKAKYLTRFTKYEKYITGQIVSVEKKILEQQENISALKIEAGKAMKEKKLKTALEFYRKILEFPLKLKERKKIENELLRVKAYIYRFEMQGLLENNEVLFGVGEI